MVAVSRAEMDVSRRLSCYQLTGSSNGYTLGLLKDKALFTPGPLTTSPAVKEAMLRDLGSRDIEFIRVVKSIRQRLLNVANLSDKYTSIIVQGAGTFAIESTVTNAVPRNGKLLVVANGAYGHRIADCGRIIPDIEVNQSFSERDE